MTRGTVFAQPSSANRRLSLTCLFVIAQVSSARAQSAARGGWDSFGTVVEINPVPAHVASAALTAASEAPAAPTETVAREPVRSPPVKHRVVGRTRHPPNPVAAGKTDRATDAGPVKPRSIRGSLLQGDAVFPAEADLQRGLSILDGPSTPAYVIDGVIVSSSSETVGLNAMILDPGHPIPGLDASDIDTLEVLTSASAAAMYGARAANGVVVITTKRGRAGRPTATVTQRFGFAQPSKRLGSRTFTTAEEVCQTFHVSCDEPGDLTAAYMASHGKTYDHEAELVRPTFTVETVGAVSGGSENTRYRGSLLYRDNPGVLTGTFLKTQSGRIALDRKLGTRVRLGVTAQLSHTLSDRGMASIGNPETSSGSDTDDFGRSPYGLLSSTPSFVNLQPANGTYPGNPALSTSENPLQTSRLLQNREDVWRRILGSTLSIDAFESDNGTSTLKLLGSFGADSASQNNDLLLPAALLFELSGTMRNESTANLQWQAGGGALWTIYPTSREFRSALSAGVSYESLAFESIRLVATGFAPGRPDLETAMSISSTEARRRTESINVYAQEELAVLQDRLTLIAGLLGEGASLNGNPAMYYLYPKLAAAYSLIATGAGEPAAFDLFDALRLRAAFGDARKLPSYAPRFTPLIAGSNTDGNPGLVVNPIGADLDFAPVRQRESEIGLDLATTDQRVVVDLTGYQRNSSNLIQGWAPCSTGCTSLLSTSGDIRNRGIEGTVQVRPIVTRQAAWTSRGRLTLNRSKITHLPGAPYMLSGSFNHFGAYRIESGRSPTQIVAAGPSEWVVVGNSEPDFRVGWSNVVSFGGLTFAAQLDWQHGADIVNATRLAYDLAGNSPDVEAANQRLDGEHPRPYIEDASFVKLRELTVSYALPQRLASQLGPLTRLELSLSGRNLKTFTRYSGLDPEFSSTGSFSRLEDLPRHPPSRSYWIAVTAGI